MNWTCKCCCCRMFSLHFRSIFVFFFFSPLISKVILPKQTTIYTFYTIRGNGRVFVIITRALLGLFSAHCCSARLRSSMILGGADWGVVPGGSDGPSRPSAASAPAPSGRACGWKGIRWSWSILDVRKSAVTPPPPVRRTQDTSH